VNAVLQRVEDLGLNGNRLRAQAEFAAVQVSEVTIEKATQFGVSGLRFATYGFRPQNKNQDYHKRKLRRPESAASGSGAPSSLCRKARGGHRVDAKALSMPSNMAVTEANLRNLGIVCIWALLGLTLTAPFVFGFAAELGQALAVAG
jgi:hypothetical protein